LRFTDEPVATAFDIYSCKIQKLRVGLMNIPLIQEKPIAKLQYYNHSETWS